jgi:23S rRNA U2552 (ribose-2'-O)-methylase RlmE/FtsJ
MNSYSINEVTPIIDVQDICIEVKPLTYSNITLRSYLHSVKEIIHQSQEAWERNKRYSNPYEFINTPFDMSTPSVCSYRPISRAFFKMIEILHSYDFSFPRNMKSYHLAEGPGGFIEALAYYRNNLNDSYYGMTLITDEKDIPKWNKIEHFLSKNPNIILEYGDGTGNLYHIENLNYVKEKHSNSMDFITADGGFDFSTDFNKQEENSLNLILAEICFAMVMQKKGGSFVLKVFDTFSSASIELIYLLNYLYEEVYVTKPCPSRPANSEKYIVCLNFRMVSNLDELIQKLMEIYTDIQSRPFTSLFSIPISNHFLSKIKEVNSIFGQTQIENIVSTINYIMDDTRHDKLETLRRSHVNKCIKWCRKYSLPIHDSYSNLHV